jgi:hypothetical protein
MSWFKEKLLGKKDAEGRRGEPLEQLGTVIVADDRFDDRKIEFREFQELVKSCSVIDTKKSPEDIVKATAEQAFEINNKLHTSAIPFGRAGDDANRWYGDMVSAWNTLHSKIMMDFISTTLNILSRMEQKFTQTDSKAQPSSWRAVSATYASLNVGIKPEIQKKQVVQRLRSFFEKYYLDCALTIASYSWFGEDVTGQWLGSVQMYPTPKVYPPSSSDIPISAANSLRGPQVQDWGQRKQGQAEETKSRKYGGKQDEVEES